LGLKSLILNICLIGVISSEAYECKTYDESKYSYIVEECKDGELLYRYNYNKEDDRLFSKSTYYQGLLFEKESYATSGDFHYRKFQYNIQSVLETTYLKNSKTIIQSKVEKSLSTKNVIAIWSYENGKAVLKDEFHNKEAKELKSRHIFETGLTYNFSIDLSSKYKDVITNFSITDAKKNQLGTYSSTPELDVTRLIEKKNLSASETQKRIDVYENTERIPFAVIDSGFDVNHSLITHKLFNSPNFLETAYGFRYQKEINDISLNIKEELILGSLKPIPLSHGTHVASIALKGHDQVGLVGFAGDVSSPKYLKLLSKRLNNRKIKFANMSWGFKELGFPMTPQSETYIALKDLIFSTKTTLFVAAAGNSNFDLDNNQFDYPASYRFNNILVIGALNTSDYQWKSEDQVIPAIFKTGGSNIGTQSVDIFAPGKLVNGAKLAGGSIRLSGTSMASPLALNTLLAFETIYSKLKPVELKEAILKSASYFKKDLPCLSRGVVNDKRMRFIAKIMSEESLSLENAINKSRENRLLDLPYEIQKSSKEQRLIWKEIDNSLKVNTP
jgi:hypothetical protein